MNTIKEVIKYRLLENGNNNKNSTKSKNKTLNNLPI